MKIGNLISTIKDYTFPLLSSLLYTALIFTVSHSAFWGIEQAHAKLCAPPGIKGYVISMFTNQSPFCTTFRNISKIASDASSNAFYLLTCFVAGLVYSKPKQKTEKKE